MCNVTSPRGPLVFWCALTAFLLAWNGLAATCANPLLLLQQHDGPQYHLLVRNRLEGHTEIGDTAHTVRKEGQNPIWRPGLVWIEEALAPWLGSVQASAAAASALGTTLLELAMLGLAGMCFGRRTVLLLLLGLLLPLHTSAILLYMAVGQGPEPWAAAALVAGLAGLVLALRRRSWRMALLAGALAGLAEWFRAGNYLVFAVPCVLYAVRALLHRDSKPAGVAALALLSFLGMVGWGNALVPSPVNKTVVALMHRMEEFRGLQIPYDDPDSVPVTMFIGGYQLAPDSRQTNYDAAVQRARGTSTWTFFRENCGEILAIYGQGLGEVLVSAGWGLREMTGGIVIALFVAGIVLFLVRPHESDVHALVLAAAALTHYLGPIVLLRGSDPTHYMLVILPLLILVAARGAERLGEEAFAFCQRLQPALVGKARLARRFLLVLALAPLASLSLSFYRGALQTLNESYREAEADRAALEALDLRGRTVACRNMVWFADADVQTAILPYATVPELERFAQNARIDGLLIWENNQKHKAFYYNYPYWSEQQFNRAMTRSSVFETPRHSGRWHWYPVRRQPYSRAGF